MSSQDNISCLRPWENLIVYASGKVKFCCFMSAELGNLNSQEFLEIWNGPMAKRMRRQFLESQVPFECQECPLIHDYTSVITSEK